MDEPNTPIHFGNHSCDPTLWHLGPYELSTRRDVIAGEEATLDYGTASGADGFRMACRCGAAACRGEVSSADWMRVELHKRYCGHWVPALQERIDRLGTLPPNAAGRAGAGLPGRARRYRPSRMSINRQFGLCARSDGLLPGTCVH